MLAWLLWGGQQSDLNKGQVRSYVLQFASPECLDIPNHMIDALEVCSVTSIDCNNNGVPDDCDVENLFYDCNGNFLVDSCEIDVDSSLDCNGDGYLNWCEIDDGIDTDCDNNTIPDMCDLASDPSLDCNGNGIYDACDIAYSISTDCDGNGIPDECDLASDSSLDCNGNDIHDACDIAYGFSTDCDGNYIPDECDLASDSSLDCDENGVFDACEIADPSFDCNGNGLVDSCEVVEGLFLVFILDGSGSQIDNFNAQKAAIKKVLCDITPYGALLALKVAVIQFSHCNPGNCQDMVEIFPRLVEAGSPTDPICDLIDAIQFRTGASNLREGLDFAEGLFIDVGSTFARELIVLTDGGLDDWIPSLSKASDLRSMHPPVRICAAMVTDNLQNECDGLTTHILLNKLANTDTSENQPNDQPTGILICLDTINSPDIDLLCETCLEEEPTSGWVLTKDCNGNDIPDSCDLNNPILNCDGNLLVDSCEIASDSSLDCDGNGVLNSCLSCTADLASDTLVADGVVDVSDLLVVVANFGDCPTSGYCYGDTDCSGAIDIMDLLAVIDQWGVCGGPPLSMPQTVQDCLNRYPLGSLQLEKCLEVVEYMIQQGN